MTMHAIRCTMLLSLTMPCVARAMLWLVVAYALVAPGGAVADTHRSAPASEERGMSFTTEEVGLEDGNATTTREGEQQAPDANEPDDGESNTDELDELDELDEESEGDEDQGRNTRFDLGLQFGLGTRGFRVPGDPVDLRLSTPVFGATMLDMRLSWTGAQDPQHAIYVRAQYTTSIGLRVTDVRIDGSERSTPARSQMMDAALGWRVPVAGAAEASWHLMLENELGWSTQAYTANAPLTVPEFIMTGPAWTPRIEACFAGDAFCMSAAPMLQWVAVSSNVLGSIGLRKMTAVLGYEFRVGLRMTPRWWARATYQERHALMRGGGFSGRDTLRFATFGVEMRYP